MSITDSHKIVRDVALGFVRVHVLHHAAEGSVYGLEMIDELERHGYDIGPGTLYPLLHGLEEAGFLRSRRTLVGGKLRRYYRTTKAGDDLLATLRTRIRELVDEVLPRARSSSPARRKNAVPKAD